jgi:hypothetical protein
MHKQSNFFRPTDVNDLLVADMAKACGEEFVLSYLSGATLARKMLMPWTQTAWTRLRASRAAMDVLRVHEVKLERPEPFGSPHHPASLRMAAE